MFKMIAVDLDETLLRTDKTISEFTMKALKRYRQKGFKIVYATGRGGSARKLAPTKLFDGTITMNGAVGYIADLKVYERLLSMNRGRGFLLACDRRGLKAAAERSAMHYSNFDVEQEWSNLKNVHVEVDFSKHDIDAEKIYAVVRDEEDAKFLRAHVPEGMYITISRDNLAQLMDVEATKAKAIAALAEYWSIQMNQVVAFGDDLNDLDMLKDCGRGVAMGNALDAVKRAADLVCDTNDRDGVANWLIENIPL